MGIGLKDMEILLALEEDPNISITDLADKLNLSRPTVKKRIDNLKERGMIRKPVMLYNPESLGLERKHVLVEIASKEASEKLREACRFHPYTRYRAETFGGKFGVYMQFEIPENTTHHLKEFFQILKQKDIIQNYKIFESTGIRKVSYPNLSKFDSNSLSWDFSWKIWFNQLKKYPNSRVA